MSVPFLVTDVDRAFYQERLRGFLPPRIVDIHTHVWLERFRTGHPGAIQRSVSWPSRVARESPIEELLESYRVLLPDQQVTPLIFSNLSAGDDIEGANAYVRDAAAAHGLPSLLFAAPQWSASELEHRILAGGFLGVKVYLSLVDAYIPTREIRIFDYLPPHQLEVLDRHGWIVMLHIPRDCRLRDPVNLAQMLEIERRFPGVRLIIAHVGRAYCPEDVGDAFQVLADTRLMRFDISANTNTWVFEQLIRAVGPRRILFGSDMPIVRMRTRRICESGLYVNLVPRGLYGDVSGDPHMRAVDGALADSLTFFLYEEIDAFRCAAEATGLTRADIEDVFFNNARALLAEVGYALP